MPQKEQTVESTILKIGKTAQDHFSSGLYCAESVVLALSKMQGIESDLLPRMATAFCSGMSRTCGMCGALAGALLGIGLALGRSDASGSVEPAYAATRQLIEEFEQAFGSRNCRDLLGCDIATTQGQATFREKQLKSRCSLFTGTAAEMAARIIFIEAAGPIEGLLT